MKNIELRVVISPGRGRGVKWGKSKHAEAKQPCSLAQGMVCACEYVHMCLF